MVLCGVSSFEVVELNLFERRSIFDVVYSNKILFNIIMTTSLRLLKNYKNLATIYCACMLLHSFKLIFKNPLHQVPLVRKKYFSENVCPTFNAVTLTIT